MKLVTQGQFDAAIVKVLGEDFARVIPNRVDRHRQAIHTIFMDELEKGPLAHEAEVIRAGAKALQEFGHYKWAPAPSPTSEP